MTLLGICIFTAIANANTASIVVTVKDANKQNPLVDLSKGIAVVDPSGATLANGTDYTFTPSNASPPTNVYRITGLTKKGNYSVSLGDGITTETINVTGVNPTSNGSSQSVTMIWATKTDTKSGSIGGIIYESNLTTRAAIANVKIIASAAAPTWTTSTTTGAFKVYLPVGSYNLIVYGKDPSQYKNDVYPLTVNVGQIASPFDTMTNEDLWASATANAALMVKAGTTPVFGSDLTLTFTDNSKLMTNASTTVFITTGSAITTTGAGITLPLSNSLYTLTPGSGTSGTGKIVIKAAAFDIGTYIIRLSNGAYNVASSTVSNVQIGASSKNAPSLTVQTAKTDVVGQTKLTVTPTVGNSIYYKISPTTVATADIPKLGEYSSTNFSALALNSTGIISGLDLVNRKFLLVYELTPCKAVAKFTVVTLTNRMINTDTNGPALSASPTYVPFSVDSTGKIVRLTFDKNIYTLGTTNAVNTALLKAIKYQTTTTSAAIALSTFDSSATVDVSGKTLTITLKNKTFSTGNLIKIAANALQSAYAVKTSLITITCANTTPTSAAASAIALANFTWAPGTATGTTQVTLVPTGQLMYLVGSTIPAAPNLGDPVVAGYILLTPNTNIAISTGQNISIIEVEGTDNTKIVQWVDVPFSAVSIKQ
jgi:hypothetical protein